MASIRGDVGRIEIGDETNVQDGAVIHSHTDFVTRIGSRVNIGHNATVHAREIGDDAAIGMGAVIMLGCIVAEGVLIGNSSLLHPKTVTEPRKIYAGVPARYLRDLSPDDPARIETDRYIRDYVGHAASYPKELKRLRD
jgi:carbonic anhydrase/acetyltransferase-like protein (isoleucine patch superfamily)